MTVYAITDTKKGEQGLRLLSQNIGVYCSILSQTNGAATAYV